MAAGPIPFSAIDRYGERYGLDGEDFAYFVRMIRAMDQAVLGRDETPKPDTPTVSSRPLTPELFDAIFG
jgi:hypothetical protein